MNSFRQHGTSWLREQGLIPVKEQSLKVSPHKFPGGGHFGIEVPTINSFEQLEGVIKSFQKYDIPLAQVNETWGASLLPQQELVDMLHLAKEHKVGIAFSCTPRPEYDRQCSYYRTTWGKEQGRRINNFEALSFCLDEAVRLSELGCRGLLVYDLGVVSMLNIARQQGKLPKDFILKVSTHSQVTNPLTARIYVENGTNDIIAPHDLSLEMLSSLRTYIPSTILSVVMDTFVTKGGFVRFWEVNDIIRCCAPVFLKTGNSVIHDPYSLPSPVQLEARAKRVRALLEQIDIEKFGFEHIADDSPSRCIPAV